jgi:hypothetical protein
MNRFRASAALAAALTCLATPAAARSIPSPHNPPRTPAMLPFVVSTGGRTYDPLGGSRVTRADRARLVMKTVTVTGTDLSGRPYTGGAVVLFNVDNGNLNGSLVTGQPFSHGTAKFNVPVGHYFAIAAYVQMIPGTIEAAAAHLDIFPQITVSTDMTVRTTERAATSAVHMVTPLPATPKSSDFSIVRTSASGPPSEAFISALNAKLWINPTTAKPRSHSTTAPTGNSPGARRRWHLPRSFHRPRQYLHHPPYQSHRRRRRHHHRIHNPRLPHRPLTAQRLWWIGISQRFLSTTKSYFRALVRASSASCFQSSADSGASANHSFIGVPLFASKWSPCPAATSSVTRSAGSLTTSWPRTNIAKIFRL